MKAEETVYQNEETQIIENEPIITQEEESEEIIEKKSKSSWQKVVVGGVAGVVFGGASVYAASALKGDDDAAEADEGSSTQSDYTAVSDESHVTVDDQIQVAEVSDDMSFGEAFAEAREQVGAGGIFEWQGNVYGTYYADEWDKMSDEEKAEYSSHINYGGGASNHSDNDLVAEAQVESDHIDVAEVEDTEPEQDYANIAEAEEVEPEQDYVNVAEPEEELLAVVDDSEVQIIGIDENTIDEGDLIAEVIDTDANEDVFYIDTNDDLAYEDDIDNPDTLVDEIDPNLGIDQDQYLASNDLTDYIGDDCDLA